MNKRSIRGICSKALAAATGAAVMISGHAPVLASAAEPAEYISEVYLSYGETPEKARQWLTDNGYTVLDQDLNEDTAGGISWLGVNFSGERSVYLGYKTTTDEDEAITDMRAMNMNGEYSYDEYRKLLEDKRSEINGFVSDMKTALAEYRENYEKGAVKAKLAHDKMNTLLENDCDPAGIGDLLLKPIKEEMTEEEYASAEKEHADMTTLVMQGNLSHVSALMTDLFMAADTSEAGWLSRIETVGYDKLYEGYQAEYPSLSESKLNAVIASNYDEQAKQLAEKIAELKESLKVYTDCPVKAESSEAEVEAYFKEHTDESETAWSLAGAEYQILTETKFEGAALAELVTGTKYDLDEPDDRAVLYPLIDAMSEGQRALISYIGLGEMLIYGNLDENGWKQAAEDAKKTLESAAALSVYQGVDRSIFEPAGIALTSEARKLQSATGADYSNRVFGEYLTPIEITGGVTGIILIDAGIASLTHAGSLKAAAKGLNTRMKTELGTIQQELDVLADDFSVFVTANNIEYVDGLKLLGVGTKANRASIFMKFDTKTAGAVKELKVQKLVNGELQEEMINREQFFNAYLDDLEKHKHLKDYHLGDLDEYHRLLDESEFYGKEDVINNNKAVIKKFSKSSTAWKAAGIILTVAGVLLAAGSAAAAVYDLYNYYHQEYAPIPRKMIHESSDDKGRFVYTTYSCTLCNRNAQGFGKDKLGDCGDMNGDVGKEWLALYTTKDKAAGDPITADIIVQKGSNKFPADKNTTVRLFGQTDSLDIVSEKYSYNNSMNGLYIFSSTVKTDEKPSEQPAEAPESSSEASSEAESAAETSSEAAAETSEADFSEAEKTNAAGSVVGTGVMAGSCVGSAVLGALICFLIVRRKHRAA